MTAKDFARLCKRYRRAEGFTQRDVAHDLHLSQANISKFERGENDSLKIALWYVNKGLVILGGVR